MAAFQPDFKQVLGNAVFRDVLRRNVAVVVKKIGSASAKLVVEPARGLVAEQEILVDKWHDGEPTKPDNQAIGKFIRQSGSCGSLGAGP